MAMSKPVLLLMKSTAYLISRSNEGNGVTQNYIRKYRNQVINLLGRKSFNYLEKHLDGRNGYWRVDSSFNWSVMHSHIEVKDLKDTLYEKYEGEILGAIDRALGLKWWHNLSEDAQEAIHDELYNVLAINL